MIIQPLLCHYPSTFSDRDKSAINDSVYRHHRKPRHAYTYSFSSYIFSSFSFSSSSFVSASSATSSLHYVCDFYYPYYDFFIVGYLLY